MYYDSNSFCLNNQLLPSSAFKKKPLFVHRRESRQILSSVQRENLHSKVCQVKPEMLMSDCCCYWICRWWISFFLYMCYVLSLEIMHILLAERRSGAWLWCCCLPCTSLQGCVVSGGRKGWMYTKSVPFCTFFFKEVSRTSIVDSILFPQCFSSLPVLQEDVALDSECSWA